MLMVVVKASIRQASMELQIERSFSFRFSPLSVFLLCGSICWFLLVRSERFIGVVISALVVHDGQSFPCKTVHVYFLTERGQEKKNMSRWARIIQHSIQHHGTIIIMVHLLGCTVSTSTEMDPLEAFYSEVNDRHGLSTAWAPLAFILLGTVSLSLCSIIKMHYWSSMYHMFQFYRTFRL